MESVHLQHHPLEKEVKSYNVEEIKKKEGRGKVRSYLYMITLSGNDPFISLYFLSALATAGFT